MGIAISDQDLKLRKLALHAEESTKSPATFGILGLPDLLDVGSVIPVASSHPEEVKTVSPTAPYCKRNVQPSLRKNHSPPETDFQAVSQKFPPQKKLAELKTKLRNVMPDLLVVAKLFSTLSGKLPDFKRETEFIAFTDPDEYGALRRKKMASTDTWNGTGERVPGIH